MDFRRRVIEAVCEVCGVLPHEIRDPTRRTRDISDARKLIIFILLNKGYCRSMREACRMAGLQRNSAYHALRHLNHLMRVDADMKLRHSEVLAIVEKNDRVD